MKLKEIKLNLTIIKLRINRESTEYFDEHYRPSEKGQMIIEQKEKEEKEKNQQRRNDKTQKNRKKKMVFRGSKKKDKKDKKDNPRMNKCILESTQGQYTHGVLFERPKPLVNDDNNESDDSYDDESDTCDENS